MKRREYKWNVYAYLSYKIQNTRFLFRNAYEGWKTKRKKKKLKKMNEWTNEDSYTKNMCGVLNSFKMHEINFVLMKFWKKSNFILKQN